MIRIGKVDVPPSHGRIIATCEVSEMDVVYTDQIPAENGFYWWKREAGISPVPVLLRSNPRTGFRVVSGCGGVYCQATGLFGPRIVPPESKRISDAT